MVRGASSGNRIAFHQDVRRALGIRTKVGGFGTTLGRTKLGSTKAELNLSSIELIGIGTKATSIAIIGTNLIVIKPTT